MLGGNDEPWCRSCGSFGLAQSGNCPSCGVGLDTFDVGEDRIGQVVSVKSGLIHRPAICMAAESEEVVLVSKGAEVHTMSTSTFDQMDKMAISDRPVESAPGRLLLAARASEEGNVKAKWDANHVRAAALECARATLGSRRAAAVDWLRIGAEGEVGELGLTATEVAWIEAHLAAEDGDAPAAVTMLEPLPADKYLAKVGVLISLTTEIVQNPELQARAVALARPFADIDFEARSFVGALDSSEVNGRLDVALEMVQAVKGQESEAMAELTRLINGIATNDLSRPNNPGGLPITMALAVYSDAMAGTNVDACAAWLRPLTMPQYDDLIAAGALTASGIASCPVEGSDLWYLQGRTDPSPLSDDELCGVGAHAEHARRLFEVGDTASLARLATDFEEARHYEALLRVCSGDGGTDERLRPDVSELLDQVNEFRLRLAQDSSGDIPDAILADPTCWRFLRSEARNGRITLHGEQRSRTPLFASWLDLYELQACVFANDWTKVRDLAEDLIQHNEEEQFRDEVLNLAAYAQFQLGNDRAALKMLTEALEGEHTEPLIVNASIVAANLGSEEAAKFLAWIYDESPNPEVGLTALLKGVDVWLADDESVALPDSIRKSIRNALCRPLSDDAMLRLFRIESMQDRDWLAEGPVIATMTENQSDLVSFYVATARLLSPEHSATLDDVARVLIEAKGRSTVAAWVDREFSTLLGSVMDQVHVPFGEAVYLTSAITLLLESGVLDFTHSIILAAQAGAHLSVALKDDDNMVSDEAENRFLVRPLERFFSDRESQDEVVRSAVEDELSRCLVISAYSMGIVTRKESGQFDDAWNALVARERVDLQNRAAILRQEATILNQFAATVDRLSNFRTRIRRLKFDEPSRDMFKDLESDIDNWKAEIHRLRATL